jgi:hypothetical protein
MYKSFGLFLIGIILSVMVGLLKFGWGFQSNDEKFFSIVMMTASSFGASSNFFLAVRYMINRDRIEENNFNIKNPIIILSFISLSIILIIQKFNFVSFEFLTVFIGALIAILGKTNPKIMES